MTDPAHLLPVLSGAWEKPFSTRSNFARDNADEVALAASLGLITVQRSPTTYGRIWLITQSGLSRLHSQHLGDT